jgi:transposase
MDDEANRIKIKLSGILPHFNERQRRIVAAAEAKSYGYGGVKLVSEITGLCRQTIYKGIEDLENGGVPDRVRVEGGGRKKLTDVTPELLLSLNSIIDSSERGDPESPLRWTCKSVRNIERELREQGYTISYRTVTNILHELEYSLQSNRKTSEGKAEHPDRNEQFEYINKQAKKHLRKCCPVISVDTKKKELVGEYKNGGKEWRKKGDPIKVLSHDFPDPEVPKAVPYGVYDIGENTGWVNVGISADTAEFAAESIWQWWKHMGKKLYAESTDILICADSGGSNGYRSHLWKRELQKFADKTLFKVSVVHFPPGTSKWNKIEHRLFSYISINWRGKPLIDYQTIVDLIASTKTSAGLVVKARLDTKTYEKGIKVSKKELKCFNISPHKFHGEWNYTISPR